MPTSANLPRSTRSLLCASLCLALCTPRAARADGAADEAASKVLFNDGRTLAAAGDYDKACTKFEDALRLHVGVGIQYNLADCWEHLGRTASARALFLGVAASARTAGQSEREQMSRDRALALEPRLAHLMIDVHDKDPELKLRRAQALIPSSDYGNDVVVDPGKYRLEASAPHKKPWSLEIEVRAAESKTVDVPMLEASTPSACENGSEPPPTEKPPKTKHAAPSPVEHDSARDSHLAPRTLYTLSLAGVGVGALAVGSVFALKYHANNVAATETCPTSVDCTQAEIDHHQHLVDDAKMFRTWSFVGFGVGGAALIGATAFYLGSAPSAPTNARTWTLAPVAGSAWGVSAFRSF
ncbi:MAG TPA: hypothetical protein VGM29_05790 [Polyangiaceae bacterium]|jgi:hypothetical protein